jgi:competence protein ComEC
LRPKRPGRDDSWILHGFWYADLAWLILRETLAATTIATLAVAPFTLFTFHRLAIYGVLANAVAEPLFNLIIMPLVALVLVAMPFGLEAGPLFLVDFCVGGLLWIARSVSALPGSVALVPQMPVAALAAMTLGGAWLCLWKLGWRYLGLLGVAIGMLLTVGGAAPDILIGRDGTQIAYRLAGGELAALPGKGSAFDLAQWLEADADGRDASDVRSGAGARCDGLGCTALVKGMVLAVSDHPASLRDDCPDAQILILRYRQPAPCIGPLLVLDMRDLRVGGAHAVRIGAGGRPTVATVSDSRGDRPWSHSEHLGRRDSLIEDFSTPGWQHGTRPPRTARKPFKTHHGKSKPAPSEVASPAETAAHTTSEPMSSALADATPPAEFQQPQ